MWVLAPYTLQDRGVGPSPLHPAGKGVGPITLHLQNRVMGPRPYTCRTVAWVLAP